MYLKEYLAKKIINYVKNIINNYKGGENRLELKISNNKVEEIDINQNITQEFINELQDSLQKNLENDKWNEQNFINELAKEFNIPQEHLKQLNNKIDNFIESIDSTIGTVNYISYDPKTKKFYQNYCTDKGMDKCEMYDEWAKSYGSGSFSIHFNDAALDDCIWYRDAEFIKEDIKTAIKDYLNDGNNIENMDFSQLKEKYADPNYIKTLYEKYYDYNK